MSGEIGGAGSPNEMRWDTRIPVFSNTVVLRQLAMCILIPLILLTLFLIILDPEMIADALLVFLLLLGIFIVLIALAAVFIRILAGGGLSAAFVLDDDGISYYAGENSRLLNRITAMGGAVGGSPALLGGSMINISRESEYMAWEDVRSVTAYDSQKTIVAYRKSLISPIGIFCTGENYGPVKDYINARLPGDVKLKKK